MNVFLKADLKKLGFCAALFAVLYVLLEMEIIGAFWELNLVLIIINIILATSLNMINGYTGQFSIGHAGFFAVGAYMGAIMTVKLGYDMPVALIAGTLSAGLLGFLVGLPTLRLNGDYLAIATLGLGEIIRIGPYGDSPPDDLSPGLLDHDCNPLFHQKLQEFRLWQGLSCHS